jgi:hypothetical protein
VSRNRCRHPHVPEQVIWIDASFRCELNELLFGESTTGRPFETTVHIGAGMASAFLIGFSVVTTIGSDWLDLIKRSAPRSILISHAVTREAFVRRSLAWPASMSRQRRRFSGHETGLKFRHAVGMFTANPAGQPVSDARSGR